jgi:hypothetical protein
MAVLPLRGLMMLVALLGAGSALSQTILPGDTAPKTAPSLN